MVRGTSVLAYDMGLNSSGNPVEARRSRQSSAAVEDTTLHAPQMPTRKPVNPTVVIAPRSPLEFEGDSDYEGSNCDSRFDICIRDIDAICD